MKSPFRSPLNCITACTESSTCGVLPLVKVFGKSVVVRDCSLYNPRRRDDKGKAVVGRRPVDSR